MLAFKNFERVRADAEAGRWGFDRQSVNNWYARVESRAQLDCWRCNITLQLPNDQVRARVSENTRETKGHVQAWLNYHIQQLCSAQRIACRPSIFLTRSSAASIVGSPSVPSTTPMMTFAFCLVFVRWTLYFYAPYRPLQRGRSARGIPHSRGSIRSGHALLRARRVQTVHEDSDAVGGGALHEVAAHGPSTRSRERYHPQRHQASKLHVQRPKPARFDGCTCDERCL